VNGREGKKGEGEFIYNFNEVGKKTRVPYLFRND
jgi:hypothetical protein